MTTTFPLPLDHTLLHLVKYNVFRGLVENKMILDRLTMQYQITNKIRTGPFSYFASFPNSSVILPVVPNPSARSLTPTASQMTMVHSSWINVLPFPAMRENMIKWESDFDHSELVKDLVGNLINLKLFPSVPPSSSRRPAHAGRQIVLQEGDDGEPTAITEPGLILWGEPYRAESWEATPEFLQKWAWAVAGSRELIDSTNYWRSRRGENPLRLVSVDDGASP
ncbi:hypothetical protein A1O3_05098 [Capronia epimyces CBS 606.96]|uniref:Uncharacterized protein n=1 Tax=Capronia epimyces CBS 606.96 TaxID=1182542 RepID=W9Y475_9EURO|nr:uncharacterized protein A1O3_05098 [Capronia epimyces CBS 606.96]EXJ84430.1 hypothetical protein A1O3_05098 [Capronia epimyces CBS 606.96]